MLVILLSRLIMCRMEVDSDGSAAIEPKTKSKGQAKAPAKGKAKTALVSFTGF
jgi:hypothetical protein